MKILEDHCTDSSNVPGWQEFARANHLLSHTTWLGRGDVLAVQCSLTKALYLLYIERYNAAYDATFQCVRLCFQNGLNRQPTWTNCSPFEIHMRQRIFWSIYCLDRNVAQVCGMPYLIRDTEFHVDLPAAINDQLIGENEDLAQETPGTSAMPYQHGIVKWGRLSAEVWDKMFGLDATAPISIEFIAIMDARLNLLHDSLPDDLQWKAEFSTALGTNNLPRYIVRQACILHLVGLAIGLMRQDTDGFG